MYEVFFSIFLPKLLPWKTIKENDEFVWNRETPITLLQKATNTEIETLLWKKKGKILHKWVLGGDKIFAILVFAIK